MLNSNAKPPTTNLEKNTIERQNEFLYLSMRHGYPYLFIQNN
jgi:hypothetical protein